MFIILPNDIIPLFSEEYLCFNHDKHVSNWKIKNDDPDVILPWQDTVVKKVY